MRKILYPIQKLLMIFFYFELMVPLPPLHFASVSFILFFLTYKFEGFRPYSPLLVLIVILELTSTPVLQLIVVIIGGISVVAFKIYDINVPLKGKYLTGHHYLKMKVPGTKDELLTSVFYPTTERGQKVEWIYHHEYNQALYEIFHNDPKTKRLPYQLFKFMVSFIHKIWLPVEGSSPLCCQTLKQNSPSSSPSSSYKVIVFSHGLGAHLNAYSSFFCNWASNGYIIVSLAHKRDEICVDYRVASNDDMLLIKDYLFEKRNRDLKIRVEEMAEAVRQIQDQGVLSSLFGRDIKVEEIILAGQSYGGATAFSTKAHLNQIYKDQPKKLKQITKIIGLDPWLFPLDDQIYANLKNQNILLLNSQSFYEVVPELYHLQTLYTKVLQNNPQMVPFMVTKTDHLSQCDMAYVFGNILKFTGSIKMQHLTDKFMKLFIIIMENYLNDKKKEEILEVGGKYVKDSQMDREGVELVEEYRVTRDLTFARKAKKQ